MEFDVNKMNRVCRDKANVDIFKSKYIGESVPYIHYCDADLYCIPVDGKRIYDPLFDRTAYIVGTIVGSNLRSKGTGIYQSDDDGSKIDDDEKFLFEKTGTTAITKAYMCFPHDLYSDGTNAYLTWWYHLVRIDYMILTDPMTVAEYHYGDIHRFLNMNGREKIWDDELKPKLSEKPLLPMLADNARTEAYQYAEKLKKVERETEYANKVYSELRYIMENTKPDIRTEKVEETKEALLDPYME